MNPSEITKQKELELISTLGINNELFYNIKSKVSPIIYRRKILRHAICCFILMKNEKVVSINNYITKYALKINTGERYRIEKYYFKICNELGIRVTHKAKVYFKVYSDLFKCSKETIIECMKIYNKVKKLKLRNRILCSSIFYMVLSYNQKYQIIIYSRIVGISYSYISGTIKKINEYLSECKKNE